MKTRNALFAVVPLAAAAYLWVGHETPHAAADDAPVTAARPTTLVAPARVEPARDPVALAFEVQGRIVKLEVEEGDKVVEGQVIARLDDRMAAARLASAKASLGAAEARYAMARRGARAEDLAAAKAEVAAAEAEASHRELEQTRTARLGDVGAVPTASVDADSAAARVAHANADAATARYQALARGTRVELVQEAAAAVEAAKAEVAAATVAVDQTVLKAPRAGVVLRRTAEVGALTTLMPPTTVVTMADLGTLEVRAEIDEADVAMVGMGMTAYATADAFGEKQFPVHVTRITHELGRKTVRDDDPRARVDTRVLEVVARFDSPVELPLGLRMSVHVGK